jgi:RimJ/RimL family protein N-acetyltransferase
MWELGVWTRPSWQHRGVMSEALTTLLAWMKSNNPNIEIVIKIDATNTVSWQLATKVGFKSVGVYQIDGFTIMMYSSNPQGVDE